MSTIFELLNPNQRREAYAVANVAAKERCPGCGALAPTMRPNRREIAFGNPIQRIVTYFTCKCGQTWSRTTSISQQAA